MPSPKRFNPWIISPRNKISSITGAATQLNKNSTTNSTAEDGSMPVTGLTISLPLTADSIAVTIWVSRLST